MNKGITWGPVCLLIIYFLFFSPLLAQNYPEGMVAYWKFDEGNGTTAYDLLGDHDGILSKSDEGTLPEWTTGIVGGALLFDGVGAFVDVPHDPGFNPGEQFTLEVWGFLYEPDQYGHDTFIAKHGPGIPGHEFIAPYQFWVGGCDWLAIDFNNGYGWTPFYTACPWEQGYNGFEYEMNQWNHVVFTKEFGTLRMYYNGNLILEGSGYPAFPQSDGPVGIGANPGGWGSFNGIIDEVAIYSRALTLEEIKKHYQNGLNGVGYEEKISVSIDIKPDSDNNSINIKNNGVIPVVILTTNDFDATIIDVSTVSFGPDGATKLHKKGHIDDINGDGVLDLMLHFKTQATGIQCGDTEVSLSGTTIEGQDFTGTDAIQTSGCGSNKKIAAGENGSYQSSGYTLFQNYPNPFNPVTTITYALPKRSDVTIKLYDINGKVMSVLVNEEMAAGEYQIVLDAHNIPSGVYFYSIDTEGFVQTKKLTLLK